MRIAFYCNDPSCSIDKSSEGTPIIIPTDLNYQHLTDLYKSLSSEQITCDLSFQIIHPTDHPILSLQDQDKLNKEGVGKEFSIPSSTLLLEEVVKKAYNYFNLPLTIQESTIHIKVQVKKEYKIEKQINLLDWISCITPPLTSSPNSLLVGCYDGSISLVNWINNKTQTIWNSPSPIKSLSICSSSPNLILSGTMNGNLYLNELDSNNFKIKELKVVSGHDNCISKIISTPLSNWITVGWEGKIKVWDEQLQNTPCVINDAHTAKITDCCLKVDQQNLLTVGWDNYFKKWSIRNDNLILDQSIDLSLPINCIDSNYGMIVVGTTGGNLQLIDDRDSSTTTTIGNHNKWINSVKISPSNQNLLSSCGADCSLKIWDLRWIGNSLVSVSKFDSKLVALQWLPPNESSFVDKLICGGENSQLSIISA